MGKHARKRAREISPDEVHPGIAKGLTQGVPAKEALDAFPVQGEAGIEIARRFSAADKAANENLRDKSVHFIARLDPETIVIEPNTGRRMVDAHKIVPAQHRAQMASGYRCLECCEPFDVAYPDMCPVCGFAVRDRQQMRTMVEFDTDGVHIGPSKPIRELLDEQESRMHKRDFIIGVIDGGQGKIPREWLQDSELMAALPYHVRRRVRGYI